MAEYRIPDKNMKEFEKKMNVLRKRCERNGLVFHYEIVGHDIDSDTLYGHKIKYPVTLVDVDGEWKGKWQFLGTIDHFEGGNVVRAANAEVHIPEKFWNTPAICEHCGTHRNRKRTYIVTDGNIVKQIGKSCLFEYTGCLSAEAIAAYQSIYSNCIEFMHSNVHEDFVDIELFMACVIAAVDNYGFITTTNVEHSTKNTARKYYNAICGLSRDAREVRKEMEEDGIAPEDNIEKAKQVIKWCKQLDGTNNYIHNLHIAFSQEFFDNQYLGLAASAYTAYLREVEKKETIKKYERKVSKSEWVGEIGQTIDVDVDSWRFVTSSVGIYGTSLLYEFITTDGNILKWWTQKDIKDDIEISHLRGKVKKFEEYKGRKSTIVNYCKIK